MIIRQLHQDEIQQGTALIREVFEAEDHLGYDGEGASAFLSLLDRKAEELSWLGAFEKDLQGVLAWNPDTMHMVYLFVREEKRRRRIGTFLVEELSKRAFDEGFDRLTVNARTDVLEFYEFNGFVPLSHSEENGVSRVSMELPLADRFLGTLVTVTVEHTVGQLHEVYADEQYPCNYGYIEELAKYRGIFQDAYVIGVHEPVDSFQGYVTAVIYRYGHGSVWVVTPGTVYSKDEIINTVAFQEQYYDTRIVWYQPQSESVSA
ncbi:MAG: GNAT family N-acetyltransferase [Solobacterium sp.]|nr:GNAT family N-acetyltransferase [Solobacterium sp.]